MGKTAQLLLGALLSLNAFINGALLFKINGIDAKIFHHMTNDDIHVPREYIVSQSEFELYKKFNDRILDRIESAIQQIAQ